ncbi:autophagy-related protein 9A-like isoform X1 [Dermacentor silvarum]|uniref:autophagy-related protein 9A-like isoform X1 n=1 Tax=Dermacentor silvarum TaxID=543639 RepID=UPI00189B35AE|nr:autophagy-related protein 9A-like isoform X1 [Dermacentor silvarum]
MASLQTAYRALPSDDTEPEGAHESSLLIHTVPDSSRTRWNHVEDLDSFFTRVYQYHQNHGFTCMMLHEILELAKFVFVVVFSTFLINCVDYPVLFRNKPPPHNGTKVTMNDVVIPSGQCVARFGFFTWLSLVVATVYWLFRAIRVACHLIQFIEIRAFYVHALHISASDLDNMTWHEVQRRVLEVQKDQQMCIHKQELTELDIYNRILRYKNYMVALVNKDVLPLHFTLPLLGSVVYLTQGLKYNLELILFWFPGAPFENTWHLREQYKRPANRDLLAQQLSRRILWVGLVNLVLLPLVLAWQVMYFFYSYTDLIKREPGVLGLRTWSPYGRLFLRHFNELDHELNTRLCRGYRPACQYMSIFSSHIVIILAKSVTFFAGAPLAVLLLLTVIDEDVLSVEHVLMIVTVLGIVVAISRNLIPDENLVWRPERLMTSILAQIHYMPDHWKGLCHTTVVRDQFAHLFQYKAMRILEEVVSPVVTPLVLIFAMRPRALELVDFLRNFTVEVVGVGDVCSFALMDVRKHGSPQWRPDDGGEDDDHGGAGAASIVEPQPEQRQAQHGKTELSLMHFTLTNPHWVPPEGSTAFINNLKERVCTEATRLPVLHREDNVLFNSLNSLSGINVEYSELVSSVLRNNGALGSNVGGSLVASRMVHSDLGSTTAAAQGVAAGERIRGGISRAEGPLATPSHASLLNSICVSNDPYSSSVVGAEVSLESTAANMSFSTLFMHELHQRHLRVTTGRSLGSTPPPASVVDPESHSRLVWQGLPHILESPQEGSGEDGASSSTTRQPTAGQQARPPLLPRPCTSSRVDGDRRGSSAVERTVRI